MQAAITTFPAPVPLTAHRPTLKALTGVRFFAASYVVVFHTRLATILQEHGHWLPGNFLAKGYFAVPIFFMLSGFILAYTYKGQIESSGSHRRFWEARFARLWPAYALSILLAMLLDGGIPKLVPTLAAAFMVQAWNPMDPAMAGAGNFVCWSLSVEAFFYLVFPYAQTWLQRRSAGELQAWLAGMLALCIALNSGARSLGYTATGIFVWIPLPVLHLGEFLVGVCLGNLFLLRLARLQADMRSQAWTYGSLVLSVAALCTPETKATTLAIIPLCGLIYGLAWEKTALSRLLSTPLLVLGGGISYSIYLFQLSAKGITVKLAGALHYESATARMLAVFPLLILMAYCIFRWVEEPSRKSLRRFFAAREQRTEARTAKLVS